MFKKLEKGVFHRLGDKQKRSPRTRREALRKGEEDSAVRGIAESQDQNQTKEALQKIHSVLRIPQLYQSFEKTLNKKTDKTAEGNSGPEKEKEKLRTTLLMAITRRYLAKFPKMTECKRNFEEISLYPNIDGDSQKAMRDSKVFSQLENSWSRKITGGGGGMDGIPGIRAWEQKLKGKKRSKHCKQLQASDNSTNKNWKLSVNTAKASSTNNFSTARQNVNRQTILTSTALKVNTVKPIDNSHRTLQNKGIIDSGCSRHMTGNKAYLADFQDYNGGPVAFGGSKGYITGKGKIKTENIVPLGGLACLIAKATTNESNLWHRRLGHVNFKNLNRLVKGNLVRGLPTKLFQNDHTCVACQKGKQHKASCKPKLVSSISNTLQLLHMDLFGPTSVRSINHKTYCLVITDDFSRFSWTFFLRTKDETSAILKDFIRQIENQLNQKGIRGEFRQCQNSPKMELLRERTGPLIEAARTSTKRQICSRGFKKKKMNCLKTNLKFPFWHYISSTNTSSSKSDKKRRKSKRRRNKCLLDVLAKTSKQRERQLNEEAEVSQRILNETLNTLVISRSCCD
ncbi:putative ribonuclease H-like domain-containing protein [Tanacetum coccineum]